MYTILIVLDLAITIAVPLEVGIQRRRQLRCYSVPSFLISLFLTVDIFVDDLESPCDDDLSDDGKSDTDTLISICGTGTSQQHNLSLGQHLHQDSGEQSQQTGGNGAKVRIILLMEKFRALKRHSLILGSEKKNGFHK